MAEVRLSADGERALAEGEHLAAGLNVAIEGVEFLLAGALSVLREEGRPHLPDPHALEHALRAVHGEGSTPLSDRVMPAPTLRQALNMTAGALRREGGTTIDALIIARGHDRIGRGKPGVLRGAGSVERGAGGASGGVGGGWQDASQGSVASG